MTDQQIADVTNYIRNAWGNAAPLVTADQVAKARRAK
jgi:mono/diheme cytochrome c family protein